MIRDSRIRTSRTRGIAQTEWRALASDSGLHKRTVPPRKAQTSCTHCAQKQAGALPQFRNCARVESELNLTGYPRPQGSDDRVCLGEGLWLVQPPHELLGWSENVTARIVAFADLEGKADESQLIASRVL